MSEGGRESELRESERTARERERETKNLIFVSFLLLKKKNQKTYK